MKLISVSCNHCGAPIEVPRKTRFLTCTYCESRLEVREEGNAYFTAVLEAIGEKTDQIAGEVEILQLQNDLLSLDQKWVASKERYMIRGQHGVMRLPTETGSVVGMVAAIVGGGVFTIVAGSVAPPMAIFGVGVIVIGIVSSLGGLNKARAYKAAKQHYEMKRLKLTREIRELKSQRAS